MAVMVPRERWTDERLDDLNKKVDDGFARTEKKMDEGFARADAKMDEGFARADARMDEGFARLDKKMDEGFARVDADLREVRSDIKDVKRMLFMGAVAIIVALIGCTSTLAGIAFL